MSDQYRNLTAEQLRQELAARDTRINDLEQTLDAERRARQELQNAVNYLQEQQVWDVNTTDPRRLRDELIRRSWVVADPASADRRTREALAVIRRHCNIQRQSQDLLSSAIRGPY
ncbi:hypothetical protein WJX79_010839 [Trebouxia sp. C0005]